MKLKKGVKIEGVQPPIWYALGIAEMVYRNINRELVVTALTDGTHKEGSLHYKGLAADIRTKVLAKQELIDVFGRLKNILDYFGFDIVLEKDHIHIEFDPKGDENWERFVD